MTGQCVSCERTRRLDASDLCQPCRHDLRFITRPHAHRQAERSRLAHTPSAGVVVLCVIPDDDTWICDFCNTGIPVTADTLIPLIGGYALCTRCVATLPYWPTGWTHPSPRPCLCRACRLPILALTRH